MSAKIEGKHKTFKLQHGDNVREFSNVEVTKVAPGRYELTGTEKKVEARQKGTTTVVDTEVTVGFFTDHVV